MDWWSVLIEDVSLGSMYVVTTVASVLISLICGYILIRASVRIISSLSLIFSPVLNMSVSSPHFKAANHHSALISSTHYPSSRPDTNLKLLFLFYISACAFSCSVFIVSAVTDLRARHRHLMHSIRRVLYAQIIFFHVQYDCISKMHCRL